MGSKIQTNCLNLRADPRLQPLNIKCQFVVNNWTETPFHEMDGAGKLSRASITNKFSGDVEGEGALEYLLTYPNTEGGDVPFIGYERIVGRVGTREGSFTVRHDGALFPASGVTGKLEIVTGRGTGGFVGISGTGNISSKAGEHGGEYSLIFANAA